MSKDDSVSQPLGTPYTDAVKALPGLVGYWRLDGTSGRVAVRDSASLDVSSGFTLAVLVKPSSVAAKAQLLAKTGTYWLQSMPGGALELAFMSRTGAVNSLTTAPGLLAANVVHLVVGTCDGRALTV